MVGFSVTLDVFRGVPQLFVPRKRLQKHKQAHKHIQNTPKLENEGPKQPATKIPCLGILLGAQGDFFPMATIPPTASLALH